MEKDGDARRRTERKRPEMHGEHGTEKDEDTRQMMWSGILIKNGAEEHERTVMAGYGYEL